MLMCQKHLFLHQKWQSCCLLSFYMVFFLRYTLHRLIKSKCIERIELFRMTVFSSQSSIYGNEFIWFVCWFFLCFCQFCWGERTRMRLTESVQHFRIVCAEGGGAVLTYIICVLLDWFISGNKSTCSRVSCNWSIAYCNAWKFLFYILLNPANQCFVKWNSIERNIHFKFMNFHLNWVQWIEYVSQANNKSNQSAPFQELILAIFMIHERWSRE